MVHPRALVRLVTALALVFCSLPLAVQIVAPATVAAAVPQRPIMAVPHASLQSRSGVRVIIEMGTPIVSNMLPQSPLAAVPDQLAGLRDRLLSALQAVHARNVYAYHLVPDIAAVVRGTDLTTLLHQPGVRAIVPDSLVPVLPISAEPQQAVAAISNTLQFRTAIDVAQTKEPESYSLTRADIANTHGFTGAGVRVAVIDSGLDLSVPDLAGTAATDAHGVPLRVDFTGTDLRDTLGHGTACASMIASQARVLYSADTTFQVEQGAPGQIYSTSSKTAPVYRSRFRVYGMAPGVHLMSAKIFDTRVTGGQGGYESWIVRAIQWAVDQHADVISESFGGLSLPSNGSDPISQADEAAVAAGITVVAADGNEGPGQTTISSPAEAPGVIGVGASTEYRAFGQTGFLAPFGQTTGDNIASFTSLGPTTDGRSRPDLVAPGAFSWALFPTTKSDEAPTKPPYTLNTFGGTSKATPVTAGAAALVISAFRVTHGGATPSPALVRSILMSSARDLGYPALNQGAGRLDAWEAVQTAIHSGPAFRVGPGSLSVSGPVAAPFATTFAITNSGPTVQTYTIDAVQSHQIGIQQWAGVVHGASLSVYHFTVAPGLERIAGAVYWNSEDRFRIQETDGSMSVQQVAMRVSLYDPLGRFVNYSYGVATGYAAAQAVHPMPGIWTLVVTQNGRKDKTGVRRFVAQESFRATLNRFVTVPFGSLSQPVVTLAPGHVAHIVLRGHTPAAAGSQVATVRVHGDHTSAVPVVLTSYVTLRGNNASFNGMFNGSSNSYVSLANENRVYALNVVTGTRTLDVGLSWPDSGYGVFLLLIDPTGQTVDAQFNGINNGDPNAPYDFSLHTLEALWSNPVPGRWQIVVSNAVFAGQQRAEPFTGRVRFDNLPVTPLAIARTVLPGASFNVDVEVSNNNGPNVAEGYVGYATTDSLGIVPLGGFIGPFGNRYHIVGSDIYTYTTSFVPPGTRTVASSVAVINPAVTADLALYPPTGFGAALGASMPVTIAGRHYFGTSARVDGPDLPIGPWFGMVTLRRPFNSRTKATVVGTTYALSLEPQPWITFDHGLVITGSITGGQPLILLPGQHDALHASVTVPLNAAPGVYHAHLFVISLFADKVADIPFIITVQPHVGIEPARSGASTFPSAHTFQAMR